jgi:DnaJ-domain-containing protein 1
LREEEKRRNEAQEAQRLQANKQKERLAAQRKTEHAIEANKRAESPARVTWERQQSIEFLDKRPLHARLEAVARDSKHVPSYYPAEYRRKREPESEFDSHIVLGIARDASKEEIRAAYYHQMASHHPDKVAHLAEDLQELAKRKTQAINRAYEKLVNVV